MAELLKDNHKNEITYNYGLAALRVIMCFEVVLIHFWKHIGSEPFIFKIFALLRPSAVCCFMILSFLLSRHLFLNGKIIELKDRIMRLLKPYLTWPMVYFVVLNLIKISKDQGYISVDQLLWQYSCGNSTELYLAPLWYMTCLVIVTVIIFFLFHVFDGIKLYCSGALIICISIIFQYTTINTDLFSNFNDIIQYTYGRFFEMTPYSILGIGLGLIFDEINGRRSVVKRIIWGGICLL